jgi:hypothetical protein
MPLLAELDGDEDGELTGGAAGGGGSPWALGDGGEEAEVGAAAGSTSAWPSPMRRWAPLLDCEVEDSSVTDRINGEPSGETSWQEKGKS